MEQSAQIESQPTSFPVDFGDNDRDFVAYSDDFFERPHGRTWALSTMDKSLDAVGDLNEGTERDELGDLTN